MQELEVAASAQRIVKTPGREIYLAAFTLTAIVAHVALRLGGASKAMFDAPLLIALVAGGLPLLATLADEVAHLRFNADLLAGISIVTSVIVGEYLAGATIVLMLSGGVAVENYAMRRASSVLDALARRAPSIAHRQTNTGLVDVPLAEIALGDRLVILPHELVPADGVVLEGHGTMDESFLTGEPFEIEKAPGSELISGAINRASALTFRATKLPVDSRYARIMQVMQQAEADRPRMRRIADRLSIWYTPLGIGLALAGWAVSGDPRRFLAVLVIATPCPLLLAIPVAILGAISVAARRGIVLKRPSTLEHLDRCRTVIFDKTGTLTYGKPLLTEVVCSPGWDRAEVLAFAASLETYSKHPLASAVVAAARREEVALREVQRLSEKPGGGLSGDVAGHAVELVGRKIAVERGLPEWGSAHAQGLECFVYLDGRCAAMLRFRDEPRRESAALVGHLGPRHKITKVILLSGDRESEVSYLAKRLGITEVHAGKSPEEKVAIVKRETALAPTLYVGDGINDAPAMMAATAAVALGLHSDVTAESADAVILEASLAKVDEMMHISRRMRRIALQSAVGGIALSLVGMGIAAAGFLAPVAGAVAQEAIDLVAVLNALRVSRPPAELTDF